MFEVASASVVAGLGACLMSRSQLQQLQDVGIDPLFADRPDTAATNRDRLIRHDPQVDLDGTYTHACRLREDPLR
jgi:hypothetical protein